MLEAVHDRPRPRRVRRAVSGFAFSMRMSWHDLLFAHWPVDANVMRRLVPAEFELDLFDGRAWIGVVPFRMTRVGPRVLPPIPGLSSFPEINVRTYVVRAGVAGVWFFSLDATRRLAVRVARRFFGLPYYEAAITSRRHGDEVEYRAERTHAGAPAARFVARYGPTGAASPARPGSLDHWLTERYRLYSIGRDGRVRRVEVEHAPWPLAPATAHIEVDTMASSLGLDLSSPPAHLRFARRVDVVSRRAVVA